MLKAARVGGVVAVLVVLLAGCGGHPRPLRPRQAARIAARLKPLLDRVAAACERDGDGIHDLLRIDPVLERIEALAYPHNDQRLANGKTPAAMVNETKRQLRDSGCPQHATYLDGALNAPIYAEMRLGRRRPLS